MKIAPKAGGVQHTSFPNSENGIWHLFIFIKKPFFKNQGNERYRVKATKETVSNAIIPAFEAVPFAKTCVFQMESISALKLVY